MKRVVQLEVVEAAVSEVRVLLLEHIESIDRSLQQCLIDSDPEKKFSYPVSLGVTLIPRGRACEVRAKIAYSVKTRAETEGIVVNDSQTTMTFDSKNPGTFKKTLESGGEVTVEMGAAE